MKKNKNQHLENSLETHKMIHADELLQKYMSKVNGVKEFLNTHYSSDIYNVINSGSYAKHTAINSKFDIDILAPFKKEAFGTLEEMYNDIFSVLSEEYKDLAIVKSQRVSIGIEFHADEDGDEISIDVVPGRELNKDQYKDDNKVKLFVNSQFGDIEAKSHIQTNIQAQIQHIKSREHERKIIRLLKIWKVSTKERYKSFFLELLTIKAFDKIDVKGDLWDKLKQVMEYIIENISDKDFTLKDPGNSNNDVSKSLDAFAKTLLIAKLKIIIQRVEDSDENLPLYFPENEDYITEDSASKNAYSVAGSVILPSIPPKIERFG